MGLLLINIASLTSHETSLRKSGSLNSWPSFNVIDSKEWMFRFVVIVVIRFVVIRFSNGLLLHKYVLYASISGIDLLTNNTSGNPNIHLHRFA